MNKKTITIIWAVCLSPFFMFILVMFFIKQNTIEKDSSKPSNNSNKISFYDLEKSSLYFINSYKDNIIKEKQIHYMNRQGEDPRRPYTRFSLRPDVM